MVARSERSDINFAKRIHSDHTESRFSRVQHQYELQVG